ncbi:hypothetical protein ACIBO2_24555 [Nonomuraea sp. NPDC050022]|uniref:hypothetical protein n=1 Tax=unclassified Nonomuraea TaxID=2593643 RepID=UPI0033CE9140
MRRTIGVTAAVTITAGLIATPSAAASASDSAITAPPTNASALGIHRKSRKCAKPTGNTFNISWRDGPSSTTFYFNNHCKEKNRIRVWYASLGMKCKAITVNPGTKGRKKLHRIYYQNLMKVDFGKCPYWP